MSFQDSTASIRPGALFCKRYRIERALDEGGMATIYLAVDESSGLPVAIKVLFHHYADNEIVRARFLDEGRIQAMLNHPNIVHVYRVIQEPVLSFVMEYVEGGTLEDYLQESTKISEMEVVDLILPVMSAVGFAHSKGIIHRDIKPSNVLLKRSTGYLEPKVMDFGVAKISSGRHLTTAGTTVGTLHYMSPEQIVGATNIDGRADIYSLGCTLYKLCTGEVPFNAASEFALMMAQVEAEPRSPRELRPDLSRAMEAVILKALAKKPYDRFQTIKEMTKALVHLGMHSDDRPDETMTRPIPEELLRFAMEADEIAQDHTASYRLAKSAPIEERDTMEFDRIDDGMTSTLSRSALTQIKKDRLKAAERQSIQTSPLSRDRIQSSVQASSKDTPDTRQDQLPTSPHRKSGESESIDQATTAERPQKFKQKYFGETTTKERVSPKRLTELGLRKEIADSQEVTGLRVSKSELNKVIARSKESLVDFGNNDEDKTIVERPSSRKIQKETANMMDDAATAMLRPSQLKAGYEAQQRKARESQVGGEIGELPEEEQTAQQRPSVLKAGYEAQERAARASQVGGEIGELLKEEQTAQQRPSVLRAGYEAQKRPSLSGNQEDQEDLEDQTARERPSGLADAIKRHSQPGLSGNSYADNAQEIRLKTQEPDSGGQDSQERLAPIFKSEAIAALTKPREERTTKIASNQRPPWLTPWVLIGLVAVLLSFLLLLVAFFVTR